MKPTIFPVLALHAMRRPRSNGLAARSVFEKQVAFPGPDGTIVHAELRRGPGVIGLSSATPSTESNPWSCRAPGSVRDRSTMWMRITASRSAGARIAIQPYDTHYGSREYSGVGSRRTPVGIRDLPDGLTRRASRDIYPEIVYRRSADAVRWLARAFGFTTTVQVPGPDGGPRARRDAPRRLDDHAEPG